MLLQDARSKTFFLAHEAEQKMLGADVAMTETRGLLGTVCQNPLRLIAKRQIDRGLDLGNGATPAFNLLAYDFNSFSLLQSYSPPLILAQ